jgi:transmembrane sensor
MELMQQGKINERQLRAQAIDWILAREERPDDTALAADIDAWLEGNPAHAAAYDRARRAMGDAHHLLATDNNFANEAVQRVAPRPSRGRTAVATALFLLAGGATFYVADGPIRLQADLISGVGVPQTTVLEDGSVVELNAASAIAIDFTGTKRRIELLRGEAYFRVAPDPARPFVVSAGNGTTTALGTAFDVNLTREETTVTVTEHAVVTRALNGHDNRVVGEDRQVSYDRMGTLGEIRRVDPAVAVAWREKRLAFDDRPLSTVIDEIGRYIPGKIVIAQASLAQRRFSGTLDISAPQQALLAFGAAIGIKVMTIGPYLTVISE